MATPANSTTADDFDLGDLDEDAYATLVKADVFDRTTDEQAAALRADRESVEEWRQVLTQILLAVNDKLTRITADALTKQQECFARGYAGRAEWFKYTAESKSERSRIVHFKQKVEAKIAEAKRLLKQENREQAKADGYEPAGPVLREILVVLQSIDARLGEVLARVPKPPALALLLLLAASAHAIEPARFRPADVGLLYPDSQSIRCDPRTGEPADQYVAMARLEYLQTQIVPRTLRALRDVGAGSTALLATVARDQMRKFHITYSLRPLCAGQPYLARANYLWDVPQGLFARLQTALANKPTRPGVALHPDALEAANLVVEGGRYVKRPPVGYVARPTCRRDPVIEAAGMADVAVPERPLSEATCAALRAVGDAHHDQASAFLAGDIERAGALGERVRELQLAVVRLARDSAEAQLVDQTFPGDVDPTSPPDRTKRLTLDLIAGHHAWIAALCGRPDRVPDPFGAWLARVGPHGWAHYRRALYVPGLETFAVCTTFTRAAGRDPVCRPVHPDACPKEPF